LERFQFSEPHMGTLFTITLYAAEGDIATNAAAAAFQRVAQLNKLFSDYDPESELMRLRGHPVGTAIPVSTELFDILEKSQHFAELTGGAFDVTCGPYVQLWRRARRQRELPAPERIAEAGKSVGWQKLKLNREQRTVTLLTAEMRLDLGGIAKGYAADEALAILGKFNIARALVAASGDLAIGDPPPGRDGWTVAIGSPEPGGTNYAKKLVLRNAGVSTSGDTEQFVELNGIRYSHIVDPRTGQALTERVMVTVVARNATTSDALDTGLDVIGVAEGVKVIAHQPGASALFLVTRNGRVDAVASPRFRDIPVIE
jgi:thiamine biosynthesis lipoprotein